MRDLPRDFSSAQLRQRLIAFERRHGLDEPCSASVRLGAAPIDAALGGGLACAAMHEIAAACESEMAAAAAFAMGVMACWMNQTSRLLQQHGILHPVQRMGGAGQAMLWIAEELSVWENGAPYGPGLDEAGIPPERLIIVTAPQARDALWAAEEALRCRAVGGVISEIRTRAVEQTATRRLSLAAAAGGTLGLVLRPQPDNEPGAFATRWIVGAAPSFHSSPSQRCSGIGPPRLALRLVRNRHGQLGEWLVEWNSVEQRFKLATNSQPMAGAAFDRPDRAAVA